MGGGETERKDVKWKNTMVGNRSKEREKKIIKPT
jgi:hypothetical protein